MRISCNGCRVLRKGCDPACPIRPSIRWISTSQSQANATIFLAKFYGRAGLVNLLSAGPDHLRPAIFKSLLYETCGRIINPIYGSTGLLWTGKWHLCQEAVEAALNGAPIAVRPISDDSDHIHTLDSDIRHVSKSDKAKCRATFKRPVTKATRLGPRRWSDDEGVELTLGFDHNVSYDNNTVSAAGRS